MPKFKSREEYERWKSEKLENKGEYKSANAEKLENNITNETDMIGGKTPQYQFSMIFSKKGIIILILMVISLLVPFWYSKHYQPRKVAEEYLKAIQRQDIDKMHKIGFLAAVKSKGILINLLNWNFIDEKRTDHRKEMLDLSKEEYERSLKQELEIHKVDSVDKLPHEYLKEEYKSYETWRSSQIKTFNAFEENNVFYYYDNTPQVEFLLDIAFTNKLGMELKKKYILIVKKYERWEVIEFTDR